MNDIIRQAGEVYNGRFDGEAWFGRCIFLSFYCERGTCSFCFRSVARHTTRHPQKARRSLASILSEALLIRVFGWRIEFLTGGYGILDDEELLRTIRLAHQALGERLWVNLGEISTGLLEELRPYVEGIVSSIETVNPVIHDRVCPDKPVGPYEEMIGRARMLGFKQGFTIIIGLGETHDDFPLLEEFIEKHGFERITIYALRPVKGTPFTEGPSADEVAWWIAMTRIAFPDIEIIAGSAEYRLPEVELFLRAGANAITKLPATKMFNAESADRLLEAVERTGRRWTSRFTHPDPRGAADWDGLIDALDLSGGEKQELRKTLFSYLDMMDKKKRSEKSV